MVARQFWWVPTMHAFYGEIWKTITKSQPPIILLHSINQYCVMKTRELFPMKERDLKFNKTVKFSLSVANLRIRHLPSTYLNYFVRKHRVILKPVLKLEKVPFSPRKHILNYLVTYSLKTIAMLQRSMIVSPYTYMWSDPILSGPTDIGPQIRVMLNRLKLLIYSDFSLLPKAKTCFPIIADACFI